MSERKDCVTLNYHLKSQIFSYVIQPIERIGNFQVISFKLKEIRFAGSGKLRAIVIDIHRSLCFHHTLETIA